MSLLEAVAFFHDGYEEFAPVFSRRTTKPRQIKSPKLPKPQKPIAVKESKLNRSKSRVSRAQSLRQLYSDIGNLKNHIASPSFNESTRSVIGDTKPEEVVRAISYSETRPEIVGPMKRTFSPWSRFEYPELPSGHIRLLRFRRTNFIYPAWGAAFDLVSVPLDRHPPYYALSYRWEGEIEKVSCGGGTLLVTANCKAALKRLNNEQNRLYWIDAICINQQDGFEKNHQVAMMSKIYSQAEQTIAWLGEDNDLEAPCLSIINDAISYPSNSGSSAGILREKLRVSMSINDSFRLSKALPKLLRRDWFTRIWILQEVALAKEVVIRCGMLTTSWDALIAVLDYINNKSSADYRAALNLDTFRKDYQWKGRGVDVHAAMVQSRQCHATDPRDKIYALLGVCPDLAFAMGEPDYKLSAAVVWTRAQRACLRGPLSINALSLVSVGKRQEEDVPSWVPDLTTGLHTWPRRPPIPVSSDGVSTIIHCSANDPVCLHVRGTFVDALISPLEYTVSKTFDDVMRQWRSWWTRFQDLDSGIQTNTKVLAFWSTLGLDTKGATPNTGALLTWHRRVRSGSKFFLDHNTTAFRDVKASDFVETTLARIFGLTQQRTIGLFPKNAQVGDRIVLFSGGSTPYLVRPAYHNLGSCNQTRKTCPRRLGDGFELIGPCYIWGLANAETRAEKHRENSQEILIF